MPADLVRKPNSSLKTYSTFTGIAFSIPTGILKCSPGLVIRTNFPNRSITPTSLG